MMDYDSLIDRLEEDFACVYEALRPVQKQYSLTDDDLECFLDLLEYDFQ